MILLSVDEPTDEATELTGDTWKFESVVVVPDIGGIAGVTLSALLSGSTLSFSTDGTYESKTNIGSNTGTWTLSEESKSLSVTENGTTRNLTIKTLTSSEFIYEELNDSVTQTTTYIR